MSDQTPVNIDTRPNGEGLRTLIPILVETSVVLDNLANAATIAAQGHVDLIRGKCVNPDYIEAAYAIRESLREMDAAVSRFVSVFASEDQRRKHAGIVEDA